MFHLCVAITWERTELFLIGLGPAYLLSSHGIFMHLTEDRVACE